MEGEVSLIKLTKAQAPDPYTLLQGKKDKVLDSIIKNMTDKEEHLWITNGGHYTIKPFKDQDEPYMRYGDWMITNK
jgi:hypothetical protein